MLSDLGFSWRIVRGIMLVARAAGMVGHLAEEQERPIGWAVWREIESQGRLRRPPPRKPMRGPQTIAELVEVGRAGARRRPWLHFGIRTFSFAGRRRAGQRSGGAAGRPRRRSLVHVVASVLPNSAEAVFLWFGLMQLGASTSRSTRGPRRPNSPALSPTPSRRSSSPSRRPTSSLTEALQQLPDRPSLVPLSDVDRAARSPEGVHRPVRRGRPGRPDPDVGIHREAEARGAESPQPTS